MDHQPLKVMGFEIHKEMLTHGDQQLLLDDLREIVSIAPLVAPVTPSGRKMSVMMTAAGRLGWITDRKGYRYSRTHPSGSAWPAIPGRVLEIWRALVSTDRLPDCCLINFYDENARMGLHQDKDEGDFSWPVVSISLGDEARFRMGGLDRGDTTRSVWLQSGDVVVMGGAARLAFHGVDKIRAQSSSLLPKGGRINLTLRVVDA